MHCSRMWARNKGWTARVGVNRFSNQCTSPMTWPSLRPAHSPPGRRCSGRRGRTLSTSASGLPPVRALAAAAEMVERATADYPKPAFGLEATVIDGREVQVREQLIHETPFCRLLHFERDVARDDPRVLIVAPLSGHHATLLRETVRELLPDHDVYITDWVDARLVPLSRGKFDLADYVDLVIAHLRALGSGRAHPLGLPAGGAGADRHRDARRGGRPGAAGEHGAHLRARWTPG